MVDERTVCVVCAWRENCLKRFRNESTGQLRCPDYTRDVTLKDPEEKEEEDK